MGSISHKGASVVRVTKRSDDSRAVRTEAHHPGSCTPVTKMVVADRVLSEGSTMDIYSLQSSHDRCQSLGLGSPSRHPMAPRSLGSGRKRSILKRVGTTSHRRSAGRITYTPERTSCESPIGQSYSSRIREPSGGHPFSVANGNSKKNPDSGGTSVSLIIGPAYPRRRQPEGRLSEQEPLKARRMVPKRVHFSTNCAEVGKTHNRSLRLKNQQKSSKILLPKASRHATGGRRLQNEMDIRSPVRLPSDMPYSISPEEDQGGSSQSNYDSSLLAKKAVVLLAKSDVSDRPMGAPRGPRPPNTGSLQSPSEFQAAFDSLEFERSLLEKKGFSARLIATLISSRKPVTTKIYGRIWRKFLSTSGPIQEGEVPVRAVLEFLQRGLDLGLAVSTLKVHVSALAALFNYDLASDRCVARFIRACTRADSVPSPKPPPWDLNLVLSSLTESPFEPINATSDKVLTLKTALLVALTSARRVGDLHALSADPPYTQVMDDRVVLRLDPAYLPKVVSKFHRAQEIILPSFCPNPGNKKEERLHCLDVRRCILQYLEVTKPWRKQRALFVSYQGARKGLKASKQTIARWVREAIILAYSSAGRAVPEGLKAHSTRAMATSWAERVDASIDQICKAATWSSPSTFFRHYRLDLSATSDLTFGRRVLQAVIPP
ncbi:uncharacterized protein [Dendrobates tinctorius]|uniref:uncharacterized protein n=1 Tax=Dendrobates tinctorius TaxID=92724 RepID=UPI003CC958EF